MHETGTDLLSTRLQYSLVITPRLKRAALVDIPQMGFSAGQGVRIGIIDSGVNDDVRVMDHVDFTGFGTNDNIPILHGTKVAQIINHFARNCELVNIKVTDSGTNINWAYIFNGLEYAKSKKVHIINLSLGHHEDNGVQCQGTCVRCLEVQEFGRINGIIIVAAAGNQGPRDYTVNCPGAAPNIVTVGMTNYTGTGADSMSSRSMPGMLKPNLLTSGFVDYNLTPDFGTSFAAPVVTGIIAAALPVFGFDSDKLISTLYNSCDLISQVPHHHQGNGVLNINTFVEAIKNETITIEGQGQSQS